MSNRFPGRCTHCGADVPPGKGQFERRQGRFVIRCQPCVNAGRSDYGNLGRAPATFKEIAS